MKATVPDAKALRRIAHHLDPVVLVGEQGVSEAVITETRRALHDHELIKVRVLAGDRTARDVLIRELAEACDAAVVQRIGKVAVLFRSNPDPDHRLSNLSRFGAASR